MNVQERNRHRQGHARKHGEAAAVELGLEGGWEARFMGILWLGGLWGGLGGMRAQGPSSRWSGLGAGAGRPVCSVASR